MKSRIMNTSAFQRKPSTEKHHYSRTGDDSSNGPTAVSVRASPPLGYHHIRQNPSLQNINEDVVPYQIPLVFSEKRQQEAVNSTAILAPLKTLNLSRSRPLPVPNHPPTSSLHIPNPQSREQSVEKLNSLTQTDIRATPSFHNPGRRPLPQPRTQVSSQITSQPVSFSSSTYSSIPSLTHTHSRSVSASTFSDTTGITFPHSSSSYQTSFSTGTSRRNQSLDIGRKETPQTKPLVLSHSHGLLATLPRPLEPLSSIEYSRSGPGPAAKEVGFGRARLPFAAIERKPSLTSRLPPLLLSKTPSSIPALPPLDFGSSLSLLNTDFQFSSPESAASKTDMCSIPLPTQKEASNPKIVESVHSEDTRQDHMVQAPLPFQSPPPSYATSPPQFGPVSQPLSPTSIPPVPMSLPPLPPLELTLSQSPNEIPPISLSPSHPVSSNNSTSATIKKQRPVLALRTWDLEPPKRSRAKKMQVVQIQTIEASEDSHDSHSLPVQDPPKLQPALFHPNPMPVSRPATEITAEINPAEPIYVGRTVYDLQSQPRPSFLPQFDDNIWKVGESDVPKSADSRMESVGKQSGKWNGITNQLKKFKLTRRPSKSSDAWNGVYRVGVGTGGGVFIDTSSETSSRPTFPHDRVVTSSLSNLDNSFLRPAPTPKPASFSFGRNTPMPRAASAPRTMEPSLRNEPTFLDPNPGRFVPRPSTTTPIGRPIGALWTRLRLNSSKRPLGREERIDLL